MVYNFTVTNIHDFDFLHILLGERKIKYVKVLSDPVLMDGFRYDDDTALDVPAEGHLRGGFPVLTADLNQNRVCKEVTKPFIKRCPCFWDNTVLIHCISIKLLLEKRVHFHLVDGFVYCVSSLGVTGVRSRITTDIGAMVALVREANPEIPCAVGFGISTPEQAAKMASLSDGAIVGSAIVKLAAQYGPDCVPYIRDYTVKMKEAVRTASRLPKDADWLTASSTAGV